MPHAAQAKGAGGMGRPQNRRPGSDQAQMFCRHGAPQQEPKNGYNQKPKKTDMHWKKGIQPTTALPKKVPTSRIIMAPCGHIMLVEKPRPACHTTGRWQTWSHEASTRSADTAAQTSCGIAWSRSEAQSLEAHAGDGDPSSWRSEWLGQLWPLFPGAWLDH